MRLHGAPGYALPRLGGLIKERAVFEGVRQVALFFEPAQDGAHRGVFQRPVQLFSHLFGGHIAHPPHNGKNVALQFPQFHRIVIGRSVTRHNVTDCNTAGKVSARAEKCCDERFIFGDDLQKIPGRHLALNNPPPAHSHGIGPVISAELVASRAGLFRAERARRIDRRCAARREEPGQQRNQRDEQNARTVDARISDRDAEQLAAHGTGGEHGNRNRDANRPSGQDQHFAKNESDHRASLCSQRHANADFPGALRRRIGQNSVEPDSCQHGGQDAERAGQQSDGALGEKVVVDLIGKGSKPARR